MSEHTVTVLKPQESTSEILKASAPAENDNCNSPLNSFCSFLATLIEIGCNARPLMYIISTSDPNTDLLLTDSKVLVIFNPKYKFFCFAVSCKERIIFNASGYFKSCSNAISGTLVLKFEFLFKISLNSSGPSRVGLSLTNVCRFFSSKRYLAISSISLAGQPCMVDKVMLFEI